MFLSYRTPLTTYHNVRVVRPASPPGGQARKQHGPRQVLKPHQTEQEAAQATDAAAAGPAREEAKVHRPDPRGRHQ